MKQELMKVARKQAIGEKVVEMEKIFKTRPVFDVANTAEPLTQRFNANKFDFDQSDIRSTRRQQGKYRPGLQSKIRQSKSIKENVTIETPAIDILYWLARFILSMLAPCSEGKQNVKTSRNGSVGLWTETGPLSPKRDQWHGPYFVIKETCKWWSQQN